MTNIICLHICLNIGLLGSGFQISCQKFSWTHWILLQEVQLQIWRQIIKNCLCLYLNLSNFFYGYVLTQIPGGRAAELFGGKWIFGIGILITSVFTILMPIAAKTDFRLLVAVRIIEGLGEGVTFPVMNAMLAHWSPPLERSKLSTFIYAGSMMGTVVSLPITGLICDYWGWEAAFYAFGSVGVIWFIFWTIFVYDTPAK